MAEPQEREAWRVLFYRLKAYQELNGTTRVRQYAQHDPELSRWARAQRALEAQGKLLPERYWSLAELGFWKDAARVRSTRVRPDHPPDGPPSITRPPPRPANHQIDLAALRVRAASATELASHEIAASRAEPLAEEWRRLFLELLDYQEQFGVQELPGLQQGRWGPLSRWVMSQRAAHKREVMVPARKRLLDAAGFDWRGRQGLNHTQSRRRLEDAWGRGLEELARFKAVHGHTSPSLLMGTPQLTHWVTVQRRQAKRGELTRDRRERLEALGFEWSAPAGGKDDARWKQMLGLLEEFKAEHGHCRVNVRTPQHLPLSRWIRHQRNLYWLGRLDPERRTLLETVGLDWDQRQGKWEELFQRLVAFQQEHGHASPLARYPQDQELANWCVANRSLHRKGELREDRRVRLDELGFEWTLRAAAELEDPVERVREFRRRNGHFAFEHLPGEEGLVEWAAQARGLRTRGELEPKTEAALDALGFPWSREAVRWEAWFAKLQDMIQGGYPLRPSSALARWKGEQLRLSSEGALDGDQERRLEELLESVDG